MDAIVGRVNANSSMGGKIPKSVAAAAGMPRNMAELLNRRLQLELPDDMNQSWPQLHREGNQRRRSVPVAGDRTPTFDF